jgi:PAS domain-containing protein
VLTDRPEQGEADYSLALLDSLYAQAPVGLAFLDAEMRFRRVNERLARTSNVADEVHIGRTPDDVRDASRA